MKRFSEWPIATIAIAAVLVIGTITAHAISGTGMPLIEGNWSSGALQYRNKSTKATIVEINTSGLTMTGGIVRTGQERIVSAYPKVGATAGWTVGGGAVDVGHLATLPASQTGSTLVVLITGLKVGDTITSFKVNAQIESAGGAVTLDAVLYKRTAAAADFANANIGAITQVSVTADTKVSSSKTLATPEVVAADEAFYVLLTGTTAAATDVDLGAITVTVTES